MKKIAFLTTKDLDGHILDEDHLEKAIQTYDEVEGEYVPWSADVDWSSFEMAVIRTTWDYTKKTKAFLESLEKICESGCKLQNPYDLVVWNTDKVYLRDLSQKGVSVVESLYFDEDDFLERAKSFNCDKFIVKPRIGASSEGISFSSYEDLKALKEKHKGLNTHFLQPFIEEIHSGERSYFYFNGEFKYAIKKTPKEGDFRVQEEYGGIITVHSPDTEELKEAEKAVLSVKEHDPLYLRVDAVVTKSGQWKLMELEAIEPSMFFRVVDGAAESFAASIVARI
jgi:glutathione synthase/RimK-type ligase-like ATP-grasp enzyme